MSRILHSAFCLFLLAGPVLGQWPCPPGQTCRVHPVPVQGWRPVLPRQTAAASPRQQVTVNPAVVRVWSRDKAGIDSYGTGTIFDRRGKYAYVMTAAHNLDDSKQASVRVGSIWHGALVSRVDKDWDVAVLKIFDPGVKPVRLADKLPARGENIELSGFGPGAYAWQHGRLTQFVAPGRDLPFEWMEVSAPARIGDSGGPMVNARGRIVGMISAGSGGVTVGPCLPRLRRILRAVLPPYPNRPGVIVPKPVVILPVSPPTLPTPAPPPPTATDPPPTITTSILDYDELAEAILKRLDLATLRGRAREPGTPGRQGSDGKDGKVGLTGPAGPQGLPGNDGQTGLTGDAGPTPAIDINELAAKVLEKLPPIYVRKINTATGETIIEKVFLGEGFTFTMTPHTDQHGGE